MCVQVLEKERALDTVNGARTLLESELERVHRSVRIAKTGMDVSEMIGRYKLTFRPVPHLFEDFPGSLQITA